MNVGLLRLIESDKVFLQRGTYTTDPISIGWFGKMINLRYLDPQKSLMNQKSIIRVIRGITYLFGVDSKFVYFSGYYVY